MRKHLLGMIRALNQRSELLQNGGDIRTCLFSLFLALVYISRKTTEVVKQLAPLRCFDQVNGRHVSSDDEFRKPQLVWTLSWLVGRAFAETIGAEFVGSGSESLDFTHSSLPDSGINTKIPFPKIHANPCTH